MRIQGRSKRLEFKVLNCHVTIFFKDGDLCGSKMNNYNQTVFSSISVFLRPSGNSSSYFPR